MKKNPLFQKVFIAFCAFALFAAAFCVRRVFFFANAEAAGTEPFFTLESAMFFRYVKMIFSGVQVPVWDGALSHPEGVFAFKTFSLWGEYMYAWLCRGAAALFPVRDLAATLSLVMTAFFSLGAVFVFFALRTTARSLAAAFGGAAFYALTLPAVIRSSGIEISNENVALPLLALHLWLFFAWSRKPVFATAAAAGAVLGLALAAWDLVQLYVSLFFVVFFFIAWRAGRQEEACRFVLAQILGLLAVGLCSGYLRAHGFFASFPFWLAAFFSLAVLKRRGASKAFVFSMLALLAACACLCAFGMDGGGFGGSYAHFAALLLAKLRHFNVRPADPSALSFDVRLLWTPALHSADFAMTLKFFARLLVLCFAGFCSSAQVRGDFSGTDGESAVRRFALLMSVGFGVSFVFFVRLYVYAALFGAVLAGFLLDSLVCGRGEKGGRTVLRFCALIFPAMALDALHAPGWAVLLWFAAAPGAWMMLRRRGQWAQTAVLFAAMCGFVGAETAVTAADVGHWCRRFYYGQAQMLFDWCERNTQADAVLLADFGLSPCLLEQTGRRTVLHPKFETLHMRAKVRDWAEALFSEREEDFYGFCRKNRVDYYVHSRGTWSDTSPYSWRYITNTLSSRDTRTCFKFEKRPEALHHFFQVYSSFKYDVFRVVTPALLQRSQKLAEDGTLLLDGGHDGRAQEKFAEALALYPYNSQACFGLSRALNRQGRTREGAEYAKRALSLMLGHKRG